MSAVSQPVSASEPRSSPLVVTATTGRLLLVAIQLGFVLLFAHAFQIESPAFHRQVLPLACGAFLVHHWLPLRHRAAFFSVVSVAGILMVFGVTAGGWLVALGLTLIGLCHLPLPFRARVALVAATGAALAAFRAGWLDTPWPSVIWPILGSMFMFRLAIYLYDLRHVRSHQPGLSLSYFFLLPNVVFPLFPVVDYHTLRRTYYDRAPIEIYEEGIRWILRGLVHLVIYRLIYQHVVLSPAAVGSTIDVLQYLVANFGLYLRVSGQFHLIVGLLHLFGFRLPETHRFFYLASSFSDLWRRINIYWKDFMQKLVYLPTFFALKGRGETVALVTATVTVVVTTWFLHSYQWFWLVGQWLFSGTDMLFWAILGALLLANTLHGQRRGRTRQRDTRAATGGGRLRVAAQTAVMFFVMCVLWGLWTSPTIEDFLVVVRAVSFRLVDLAAIALVATIVIVAAFVVRSLRLDAPADLVVRRWWRHPLLTGVLPLAVVWYGTEPAVSSQFPAEARLILRDLRLVELNRADLDRLQRGYYEQIVRVNRFNGDLWEVYARARGDDEALGSIGGSQRASDVRLHHELRPSIGIVYMGGTFRTNQWGMRDREYSRVPGTNVRRIAVLGPSYVMGTGVNDGETFEALVEDELNRDWTRKTGLNYELLNFAVGGYSLAHQAVLMENGRVNAFDPDAVLLVGHTFDFRILTDYIWKEVQEGRSFDNDPTPRAMVAKTDIRRGLSRLETNRRLRPYHAELTRWALGRIATVAARWKIPVIFALIPQPTDRLDPTEKALLLSIVQACGFTVIDLEQVFAGHDEERLGRTGVDRHPNARGHRLIATRLYDELTKLPWFVGNDAQPDRPDARTPATVR